MNGEKFLETNSLRLDEGYCMIGNQNSIENLRLIAAQRQLYVKAKFVGNVRLIGSLMVAIAGMYISVNYSEARTGVTLFSAIWTIFVVFILKRMQKEKILNAAVLQEEFDTGLFGMAWNQILIGNKVAKEIMIEADRSFKGDRNKLKDWYPDVSQAPPPLDVLLCQRTNLLWDWRLRKKYVWALGLITTLLLGFEIAFCLNKTVVDFLTQYFIPSLSLFILAYENIMAHVEIANKKERMEKTITALYEKCISGECSISLDRECRQVQDYIYSTRIRDAMIPDFWQNLFREQFQDDMQVATREYQNNSQKMTQ